MGLFIVGIVLAFTGAIVAAVESRLCRRIVQATRDRPDRLRPIEIWPNICQFAKWRKLPAIANSAKDDPGLRSTAKVALRLEALFYCLFLSGMALMAIGAACQ